MNFKKHKRKVGKYKHGFSTNPTNIPAKVVRKPTQLTYEEAIHKHNMLLSEGVNTRVAKCSGCGYYHLYNDGSPNGMVLDEATELTEEDYERIKRTIGY